MKIEDYKNASKKMSISLEALRFVNTGLHRNLLKMYPVKLSDRIDIAIIYLENVDRVLNSKCSSQ